VETGGADKANWLVHGLYRIGGLSPPLLTRAKTFSRREPSLSVRLR